jgi:hypothetical protein
VQHCAGGTKVAIFTSRRPGNEKQAELEFTGKISWFFGPAVSLIACCASYIEVLRSEALHCPSLALGRCALC